MEIFVRPMRYKGCHQAHNAQVVICALFTTPNSLKLQERRKAFSPIRKVRAISQKLYSDSLPADLSAQPINCTFGLPETFPGYAKLFAGILSETGQTNKS